MEPDPQNFTNGARQPPQDADETAVGIPPSILTHLAALASRLGARRELILQAWRRLVTKDPMAESGALLSRVQFFDHIPEVLDLFDRRLRISSEAEGAAAEDENRRLAAEHGVVRWQQGYQLQELMEDWGDLQLCLIQELERDAAAHPEVPIEVMAIARVRLTQLCNEGISQSAVEYAQLQQAEAAGRLAALEQALVRLQELEQQRAETWREAAHDLRGNLGVVKNVTVGLHRDDLADASRSQLQAILKRGVDSLHRLLNDLVDLARLEAGHEQRKLSQFDAAQLLRELCETFRPLADERSLFLRVEGADSLAVHGDAVKVQRIAQNLILNALHYTDRGGVSISWQAIDTIDAKRWVLCVEDTGPGFANGALPAVAVALKEGTDDLREVERKGDQVGIPGPEIKPAPTLESASTSRSHQAGEGVGLSIVKRICELLDATLELETQPGRGTTFRVNFPRSYNEKAPEVS
jgi:signal transduction histidine kinase